MVVQQIDPSANEQALDEAIAEFLRAESAGKAGSRQQWLERYPACAAGLLEYFDDREQFNRLAMPLHFERLSASSGLKATTGYDSVSIPSAPPDFTMPRYRPRQFHARGGMGEVWLAHDERVGRQVAIKKLRTGREQEHARFIIEAQITGQLEHPGVVPLHDLGIDDAGQPFYVMKYIQGKRLSEVVADFHADKTSADWPADLGFVRLLQTFVSVCHAIAYAHSKGVLHRDIKPDNVMIGPYGETLVLDWGLAKVIGQPDQPGDATVQVSHDDSTATQDGAIIGTLVYMSPEGAEGSAVAVDRSSDVYLLGATLYEILTARPPRHGSSRWELIDLARTSRPISPRKLDPRIPRALEAICLKAMAFRKRDRYDTSIALADDVQRFLAGEATSAYKEPLWTRARRWIRRHRRALARALALACALVLAGLAVHGYRQARVLADRERAREQLSDYYRLADEAQFYAANTDAVSERAPYYDPRRAKAVGETALAIVAPWGDEAERLPLDDERAGVLRTQYNLLLLMAQASLQGNHKAENPRAPLMLLDKAKAIHKPSRGYYQLRSQYLKRQGLHEAAQHDERLANQPDTPVTAQDCFLQGELLRFADAGSSPDSIRDEARPTREHLTRAIEEYRGALRLDPRHYWAQFQLGRCLLALGRGAEAVEALGACVALRPDSPWAYTTRGLATALSGQPKEALVDLNRALQLDPHFQPARLNRGVVHWLLEDTGAAMADFDAVLAAQADARLIEAAYYRGQLLLQGQHTREALADFTMAIDARPDFRPAYWLRARTQFLLGNYDLGQADLARFVRIPEREVRDENGVRVRLLVGKALRQLATELAGEARTQALVRAADELLAAIGAAAPTAELFRHLGTVQEMLGEARQAIASYSKGLALAADHVGLRNLRGWAYLNDGQIDLARADFAEALRLSPDNADAHTGLGYAMAQVGAADDARKEASAALVSSAADSYLVLHNVACIYGRLSDAATGQKTEHENLALAALERAVAIARQNGAGEEEDAKIREEREAFPASLRSRPQFQRLLPKQAADRSSPISR